MMSINLALRIRTLFVPGRRLAADGGDRMPFSSYIYIVAFLPIACLVFWALQRRHLSAALCVAARNDVRPDAQSRAVSNAD
jgi:hypothetical protein